MADFSAPSPRSPWSSGSCLYIWQCPLPFLERHWKRLIPDIPRLQSATTTAGQLWELDAIAAAFIGGVSPAGGIGKVAGSIIGALVVLSLTSGMNLMGIGISYRYMARGAVLAAAVIFDVATRNRAH